MDTILFDLDGTLLPMNQDDFINAYFKGLAAKLVPYGMDSKLLIGAIMEGIKAMVGNDGTAYNSERFWERTRGIIGNIKDLEPVFLDYYENEFQDVKAATSANSLVAECIKLLKEKGYRLVLTTNPLFPSIATYSRIRWAGLQPEDFEWITTYENSSYCKPNIEYYKEVLNNLGLSPEQCIMVGNDIGDDMVVKAIGMETFLITDNLINDNNENIDNYRHGSFGEFLDYIKGLPKNR